MSYTQHNFVSGMKFTADAAADMDEQIGQNESDIRTLETRVGNIPSERSADIQRLSLEADGDSIMLYFGNNLISAIAMPDVSSLIPCTGLTATANASSLLVGNTMHITTQKQPSDSNQSIRFRSSDTNVVTVNSLGDVVATGSGSATISVSCGTQNTSLNVSVNRKVAFDGNLHRASWIQSTTYGSYSGIQVNDDTSNNYIANIPYNFDKFRIRPGDACLLRPLNNNVYITDRSFIFKEATGKTLNIVDMLEADDKYMIDGAEQIASNVRTTDALLTYTNNTSDDLYLVFAINLRNQELTVNDVIANIDSYLELVIGPSAAASAGS